MRNTTTKTRLALGLFAVCWSSLCLAQTRVIGPIEGVSSRGDSITVLGQTFFLDDKTLVLADGKSASKKLLPKYFLLGRVVTVESDPRIGAKNAASIVISESTYVAGSTPVAVSGSVEQVTPIVGTARIGGLVIDVTSLAPEVVNALQVGSSFTVAGFQPVSKGLVLGQIADASLQVISIGGTGKLSIGGTGINSIGGTGVQSIGGTGVQSIGGTGVQSIGGTGIQSIGGTGKQSIGGTGIQSIGGTGIQSIGGTGVRSIGGTGAY